MPKEQGFFSLWRGAGLAIARDVPYEMLTSAANKKITRWIDTKKKNSKWHYFLSNLVRPILVTSLGMLLVHPIDVVYLHYTCDTQNKYGGMYDAWRHVHDTNQYYTGIGMHIASHVLCDYTSTIGLDLLNRLWIKDENSKLKVAVSGLWVQLLATITTYPVTTVMKQMIVMDGKQDAIQRTQELYNSHGWSAFFRAGTATLCCSAVVYGIALVADFVAYITEKCMLYMK